MSPPLCSLHQEPQLRKGGDVDLLLCLLARVMFSVLCPENCLEKAV
jgi:hypothetical protein